MDNETLINQALNESPEEIDLREVFSVLRAGITKIIIITTIFALASVIYALSIPNQYKVTVLLASAQDQSGGLGGTLDKLGGLAAMAGVTLGGNESTEGLIAQEIMRSWSFVDSFIDDNDLAVEIAAGIGWEKSSNELIIDQSIYNSADQKWVADEGRPSSWKLYESFLPRLKVTEVGGFVSASMEYYSPYIAKKWLDMYVVAINKHMQERQMARVTRNIEYLQAQIEKTSITEMKEVFYVVIEEQIKSKMLAEASPDYVFVEVSKSMVPEKKSQPIRSSICIVGTFLGAIFASLLVLIMHYVRKDEPTLG